MGWPKSYCNQPYICESTAKRGIVRQTRESNSWNKVICVCCAHIFSTSSIRYHQIEVAYDHSARNYINIKYIQQYGYDQNDTSSNKNTSLAILN